MFKQALPMNRYDYTLPFFLGVMLLLLHVHCYTILLGSHDAVSLYVKGAFKNDVTQF